MNARSYNSPFAVETLDTAFGSKNSGSYSVSWQNNGDGTFTYIEPFRWKHTRWFI